MKNDKLRQMTLDELNTHLHELSEELFSLKFRHRSQGSIPNPLRLRELRREMARVKTIVNENKLGIHLSPGESGKGKDGARS